MINRYEENIENIENAKIEVVYDAAILILVGKIAYPSFAF